MDSTQFKVTFPVTHIEIKIGVEHNDVDVETSAMTLQHGMKSNFTEDQLDIKTLDVITIQPG